MERELTKGLKAKSEKDALSLVEKVALKIAEDEVREPRSPVKNLVAEGRRINGRVKKDLKQLLGGSAFTKSDALILQAAVDAFAGAANSVFAATAPNLPSKQNRQREEAEALLTEAYGDLAYLADETDDDDLARKIGELREGDSLDDTISDLALTAPLLEKRAKDLAAVGVSGAKEIAKRLQKLHDSLEPEQEDTSKDDYDTLKDFRDRLGLVLESHLARVRRHGKQAFKNDPKKASQYVDAYLRDSRSRTSDKPSV